ncbi:hypothetical protein DSM106972_020330 [Dulcicalothrix desertica PCC 7102]|uniref:Uncharacterized protein n=1 Tax=Dulcicalothrix desertica PCC 7102 TaxID=232991 RepID=A0A433VNQ0_9CYAN|nr:hypothetical protein [Dulcicalothrix desertica]RUT07773.1 hypothetical protein DSM106972_020330 [Dulcicalothrix desertica PCC 7102]TWH39300.1 hypothetical protein CAL7102_08521 [Dulcicalothrix desertica PCC 7102]
MATVEQRVYLLTEEQRDGLMNYLMNRPYREVANGVQFLTSAPSTILNVEVAEESPSLDAKSDADQEFKPETAPFSTDETPVLSHA